MEHLNERNIKIRRLDNGGEYTSKEHIAFCKEAGIKRELIIPYSPKKNGVDEKMNRNIEECVKPMLHGQYLPPLLWEEACMM